MFFYHPDHLGSSSYITDANGEVSQHLEYFAFGETFVEEHSNKDATPYLYNAKELDEETGLYYYGARYYDPVTSVWQSVDPPMLDGRYLDGDLNSGVYSSGNLGVYNYTYQNPVKYTDPNGECPNCITAAIGAALGGVIGATIEAGTQLYQNGSITDWSAVGGSALQGAITGGAAGFTGGASLAVTAGTAATANVVGGEVNRRIQGQETTAGYVVIDAVTGGAGGAASNLIAGPAVRKSIAKNFYKKSGFSPEKASQHMEGINFSKSVGEKTLKEGTTVKQWVGKRGVGNYFTNKANGGKQNLGIDDYHKRTLNTYETTDNVKVLKSTASDYKGNQGGGTQYFSTDLNKNIKSID